MVQTTDRKKQELSCVASGHSGCLRPSLKLKNLSRLPNAHGLRPEQPAEAAPVQATREHSRSGQSKGRLLLDDPLSDQRHQHRVLVGYVISTWNISADGTHILIQQHQVSRVCRCFWVMPGVQGLQMVQRLPMLQGMPMFKGNAMVQGIPMVQESRWFRGMSIMQQQLQPTVAQGTSFTAFCTSCQSASQCPSDPTRELVEANTCKKCGQFSNKCNGT